MGKLSFFISKYVWVKSLKILNLVLNFEIKGQKFSISFRNRRLSEKNSRSRLEARDSVDKISFSSRGTRLKEDYSRSRLKTQNRLLANV